MSQLPTLKYQSDNLAVLAGQGWVFNPHKPEDVSLLQRVEWSMPEGMSYEVEMQKVNEALVQSLVGMPVTYQRSDIPRRQLVAKAAVDRALAALNEQLPPGGIRFTTKADSAQTFGKVSSRDLAWIAQQTNLYIYLPEELQVLLKPPMPTCAQWKQCEPGLAPLSAQQATASHP